jgi:hypothetical protein
MLEPDVTLTDFALAALCTGLALSLLRGTDAERDVRQAFAALFAALALASLLGGVWHGFVSGSGSREMPIIWTMTMLALGAAASALWMISASLVAPPGWRRGLSLVGVAQFLAFTAIVLFRTQSFGIVGLAMLPPLAVLITLVTARYRKSGSSRLLLAIAGLLLVVVANVLQRLHLALPAAGLSANALYHVLQAAAFLMVFFSIPALKSGRQAAAPAQPEPRR